MSVPFVATFITISSEAAMAAENVDSSLLPPIWPFLLFVIIVIVFRKQLNCVFPIDIQEPEEKIVQRQATPEQAKPAQTIVETDTKVKPADEIIDLKDDSQQCQASTAKGTRCKRKTMLEKAVISIDNKTYSVTVCKQHNTDSLKPFPELI